MELTIYNITGAAGGKVQLVDEVFNVEKPSAHAVYMDVRLIRAHQRQGTHKTKGRGEVSGSTKKPWRQKGTGNARSGHKRSPLWRHGGTVFGPQPHKYGFKLNKKVKQLARRSALTFKLRDNKISVLAYPNFDAPRAKAFIDMLGKFDWGTKKLLFVTGKNDTNFFLSGKNLPRVNFVHADQLNTYDIINAEHIILIEDSVGIIQQTLQTA